SRGPPHREAGVMTNSNLHCVIPGGRGSYPPDGVPGAPPRRGDGGRSRCDEGTTDRTSLLAIGLRMIWTGRKPARRVLPWGLLGMTALVAAVELQLVRKNPECASTVAWSWRYKGSHVERAARGQQVLCFGDSLVNFGVIPR